jgi:hypothetical protein
MNPDEQLDELREWGWGILMIVVLYVIIHVSVKIYF